MTTSRITRGLTALLAALMLSSLLSACGALGTSDKHLTIQFTDATGLFHGNDVGIRGVTVGHVESITPAGAHVNVEVVIDGDVDLPKNVGAVIVSRSVATDRYVELTPSYTSGAKLADGAVIGVDRTKTPVEFEQLLGSLEDLSTALAGPEGQDGPLKSLLQTTASTLEGQGASIATGLNDLANVLTALSGNLPAVEANLVNLDTLTQTLADNDALVRDFVGQVTSATVMLDQQKGQIEATFNAIAAMLQGLSDFSAQHKGQIADQMQDFVALSDELLAHVEQLTQLLASGPLMTQNLPNAIDEEGRMRFLTRALDLVPGPVTIENLCESGPEICDALGAEHLLTLLGLLSVLRGEVSP